MTGFVAMPDGGNAGTTGSFDGDLDFAPSFTAPAGRTRKTSLVLKVS